MEVYNFTPFRPAVFPTRDKDACDRWVVAVKGTFRIVPGERAALADEQAELASSDVYEGDVGRSSLRIEDDFAPVKRASDVLFRAVATAPEGRPSASWIVRARVGLLERALRITGPRAWVKTLTGYDLTDPQPCLEVPVRYERAFGGTWTDDEGRRETFDGNPIGVGFVPAGMRPHADVVIAPQIEDPAAPIGKIGRPHRAMGLGPIMRGWEPRRALAGTYDDRWKAERWPNWPLDFDDRHYNTAHPDWIYPGFLRGDEAVFVEGVTPEPLRFSLPAVTVVVLTLPPVHVSPPVLDTAYIDPSAGLITLTWRCMFEHDDPQKIAIYRPGIDDGPD